MNLLRAAARIGLCLAVACSRQASDVGADAARHEAHLSLPRDAAGRVLRNFALEEWIEGPTRLEVVGRSLVIDAASNASVDSSRGELSVEVEFEDGKRAALLRFSAQTEAAEAGALLPGEGPRPLRLRFDAGLDAAWLEARLVFEPAPLRAQSSAPPPAPLRGRNVLLIVTDALSAPRMSCYGNPAPTTPQFDALAMRGVRFERAYSQTSWTVPSVASLFTSLEQERHGVTTMHLRLSAEPPTLAEAFRAAGYRTVALVQNGALRADSGLNRGFERYELYRWGEAELRRILNDARAVLTTPSDAPLLLYLHVIPPHGPFEPPAEFIARFASDYDGPIDGSVESLRGLARRTPAADDPDVVQLRRLYDAYLGFVDRAVGEVLGELRATGRDESFLIVQTSDHGEEFFEHGALGHEVHVYEEQVRVPLIFCAPGSALPAGSVVTHPVSLLDVFPTLVELCGLEPHTTLRGRSLLPEWFGAARDPRAQRPLPLSARYREGVLDAQLGLLIHPYKLVLHRGAAGERLELFDLEADPGERRDLSGVLGLRAAAMRAWLARFEREARQSLPRDAGRAAALDAATRDQLQQLGYAGF